MHILNVVARWAHILAAVTAADGLLFLRFVLQPSIQEALGGEQAAKLREAVARRWKKAVMASIGLLLISGLYNFIVYSVPKAKGVPLYHALFGIKFLLAMGVFFISSALVGRSPAFEPMRARAGTWMALNAALVIAVILLSGILRNLGGAPS
jgi:uncharacterized membrane protein